MLIFLGTNLVDMSFINDMVNKMYDYNVFNYTINGAKILALMFLTFKLIENYMREFETIEPKMGNILSLLGFGLIIMSSDWIIDGIETVFSDVSTLLDTSANNSFINTAIKNFDDYDRRFQNTMDSLSWYEAIDFWLLESTTMLMNIIAKLLAIFIYIADACLVGSYLVLRVFFLQLLKFLFPIAVALSTSPQLGKIFWSWILRYIGVFLLGISYVAIIAFTNQIQDLLYNSSYGGYINNSKIRYDFDFFNTFQMVFNMGFVLAIKGKLFASVTSYINSYFQ